MDIAKNLKKMMGREELPTSGPLDAKDRDRVIAKLLEDGMSLSDLQKTLETKYGCKLTYMELRLISADLKVSWKRQDAERAKAMALEKDLSKAAAQAAETPGATQVTISKLVRPGSVLSGEVTFKSGARAEWFVDQAGRLGLNPIGTAQPDKEDIQDFQVELQKAVQNRMGG